MKTKSVPALIMLLAGAIACIAGIASHLDVAGFVKMLLIVLIVFYLLGCIVKMILDSNFKTEETTDGEAESELGETEENAEENSEADGEDEHKDE